MAEWLRAFPPPLWAYAAGGWAMIAELADCANAGRLVVALLIGPVILCSLLFGRTYEPVSRRGDPVDH
jgi:hypothetical protein